MFEIVNRRVQKTKEVASEDGWKAVWKKGAAAERSTRAKARAWLMLAWLEQRARAREAGDGEPGHTGP